MSTDHPRPTNLEDIDWDSWRATDRATLTFVVRAGQILLIRKKRGLGAGKINGPGGRIEPDESAAECAVREVQEELCVTPVEPIHCGELRFQFVDGYSIHVFVFVSSDCIGAPQETEEAIPIWAKLDEIPYSEMWEDDELWIPVMLDGRQFAGRFIFDDDRMLAHQLEVIEAT